MIAIRPSARSAKTLPAKIREPFIAYPLLSAPVITRRDTQREKALAQRTQRTVTLFSDDRRRPLRRNQARRPTESDDGAQSAVTMQTPHAIRPDARSDSRIR